MCFYLCNKVSAYRTGTTRVLRIEGTLQELVPSVFLQQYPFQGIPAQYSLSVHAIVWMKFHFGFICILSPLLCKAAFHQKADLSGSLNSYFLRTV